MSNDHSLAPSPPAPVPGPRISAAWIGAGLALLSMTSVQFGTALSAPIIANHGVFHTTWLRLTWAALALLLIARPRLRGYGPAQWRAVVVLGVAMSLMTFCFFAAITRIPLGLTVAIDFLGPLAVATWGSRSRLALLWPLAAFAGVILLAHDGHGWIGDLPGLLLALGSGIGWGTYIVLMKRTGQLFAGLDGLALSLTAAAIVATPFGLIDHGGMVTFEQLIVTAGLAVMVPLLPYALEFTALRRLPAASFGILMSIEPALGALAGLLILGQPLTLGQTLGTALVVAASIGAVRAAPSRE